MVPGVSRLLAKTKDLDRGGACASEVKRNHLIRHPGLAIPAPKSLMNRVSSSPVLLQTGPVQVWNHSFVDWVIMSPSSFQNLSYQLILHSESSLNCIKCINKFSTQCQTYIFNYVVSRSYTFKRAWRILNIILQKWPQPTHLAHFLSCLPHS